MRDLLQAARADPVGALFVFLHLLKRQAKSIAEFLLAHSEHHAAHAHAAADVLVDRVRCLFSYHHLNCFSFASLFNVIVADIKYRSVEY